jgi:hypothetical protein
MFHVISEVLTRLLLDVLQGLSGERMLICTLEVVDEHVT